MRNIRYLLVGTALISWSVAAQAQSSDSQEPATDEDSQNEIVVIGSQIELGGTYEGGDVGRAARAGVLGNRDYLDTPFSVLSLTDELARKQQASSITDVLRNDPTVQTAKGFGNFQEVYIIRGFPVFSDDTNYNGLFGILPRQSLSAELIERVEVFRGASAFVNGASVGGSGSGGLINIVPKRADADVTRLTIGARTGLEGYLAGDVGRTFGSFDEFGIRANGVYRDGETSVDGQDRETTVLSFAASYEGERFRFTADIGYQDILLDQPRPQVTPSGAIPDVPDADANYAVEDTFSGDEHLFGTIRGEFDFSDNVTAWFAFGGRDGEENNVLANPTADENGDFSAFRFDNVREESVYAGDAGIRASFKTGNIGHQLVASASFTDLNEKNAFAFQFAAATGNLNDTQPVALPPIGTFLGGDLSNPLTTREVNNFSLAIADTLSLFDERLLVTLGVRYQEIETQAFDFNTGASTGGFDESAFTPAVGVVFKASDTLSFFGNYAENIQEGGTAPALSGGVAVLNAGEVLSPFRGEQFEAGVKYDGDGFGITASAFSLNRPSAIVEDAIFSDNGEQRTQGIEVVAYGEIVQGLSLIGGFTLLDAELTNTQDGIDEGNTPIGVPDFRASLNARYDVAAVPGLSFDGRITYSDGQFTNNANTISIDSWTRFDIGASYRFRTNGNNDDGNIVVRVRVENVADENYWESTGGFPGANYLVQADPRTVIASVAFEF
ncbi:MAG: TonB-dependent receptor [Pseudomonadota bacterium]